MAGVIVVGLSFVVLGLPDYAHGVAWPDLRTDLDRPLADLGTLFVLQMAGYVLVSTSMGRLADRWGLERVITGSALASAAGLALLAVAPTWPVALASMLVLGLGSGGMDTGFNAAVALRSDGRRMGVLHAGYGIGAGLGPVVMGAAVVAGSWRAGYAVLAMCTVGVLLVVGRRSLGEPAPIEHPHSPRGILLPLVVFFVYVALEVTVGQWAFTALTEDRGVGELAASLWVGAYWVGLTAGRLWLGLGGHRVDADRLLLGSVVGVAAGSLLLWFGGPLTPLGLPVAGLALSVVFPLLMLLTPQRVGPERAAAAVGWQAAASSAGAAAGPALAGVVLDGAGIDAYGPVTAAMVVTFALVLAVLRRPAPSSGRFSS